jgi:hypothetical protein
MLAFRAPKNGGTKGPKPAVAMILLALLGGSAGHARSNDRASHHPGTGGGQCPAEQPLPEGRRIAQRGGGSADRQWWDLPQTNVDFEYGQVNTNANDDRISLSQSLSFPTVYAQRRKMLKHNAAGVRWEQALRQREVRTQVKQSYHEVLVLREQLRLLQEADSIYTLAVTGEEQRFDLGSSNVLQRATARTQAMLMRARVQQVKSDLEQARTRLAQLVNLSTAPNAPPVILEPQPIPLKQVTPVMPGDSAVQLHPVIRAANEQSGRRRCPLAHGTLHPAAQPHARGVVDDVVPVAVRARWLGDLRAR